MRIIEAIKRRFRGEPNQPQKQGPPASPWPNRQKNQNTRVVRTIQIVSLVVALGLLGTALWGLQSTKEDQAADEPVQVHLTGAIQAIERGDVSLLYLNDANRKAQLVLADGREVYTVFPEGYGPQLANTAEQAGVSVLAVSPKRPSLWTNLLITLLPVALLIGFFIFFLGPRMGLRLGMSKSKSKPAEVPDTRFTDVAGVDEAVTELKEVVEYLHTPERFAIAGARVPRGFLLVGPPGTGKTLLARAVAGEAGVPFFSLAGSDFVETYVGVGASRVRQIFATARKVAPAIVFIDELDAVGKARSTTSVGGGTEERENTLNQLLVEMDGFSHSGLIVLAATNRADILDSALTRPGRFDRHVVVPAPDRTGREKILRLYAKDRNLAPDVDLEGLARRTPGLTGADLAGLVNEAALEAARRGSDLITEVDIQSALATSVLGRERKSAVITDRDRKITAWHESGHAVAALALPHANDPVSVTIIPRGPAGGVTWMGGNDNHFTTRSEAEDSLVV
ncbi:MAG TPA: AAA family ATPase, partial [Acidimicrobiales bacterium]|nr:AAA family ATPase [Acidimicrobiales bacterium]